MYVLPAVNVNDAYALGLRYLCEVGELESSRAGEVLVAPTPVTIAYERPAERVLFDEARDANPFFHIFEALHMLAGRNDARWLDCFVSDFSSRFAEDDGHQHGAYGFRWRRHFDVEWGGSPNVPDQLDTVVKMLQEDPKSRRAVITMWDPVADLGVSRRDLPCNVAIFLRVRREYQSMEGFADNTVWKPALDITVCCRSNDFVWGATGANAVHFSFLHEYLAGRIGVGIGKYFQVSNNMHIYTDMLGKLQTPKPVLTYPGRTPIGTVWEHWDADLDKFMAWASLPDPTQAILNYRNAWFKHTAEPIFLAHHYWKRKERQHALNFLQAHGAISPDWKKACIAWFERRLARMSQKEEVHASK